MIPSFLFFLRGYLQITISGSFTERFLNACAAQNILLWDITRISKTAIRCKISVRAFKGSRKIAYCTGVQIKINAKKGLPFLLARYRKRKLLLFGALFFVLFTIVINQFVWEIEVRGNEKVKTSDILAALEAEGVHCGMRKKNIDQRTLKNKTMLRLPSLAWIWVDKQGSKIIVDVRERTPVPDIFDPDDYCNLVAQKDGIIDAFTIRNGVATVKKGDAVRAGTVLVTGKIPSAINPDVRYVQADGEVYAKTWYEKTKTFSRVITKKTATGQKKSQYSIKIFGRHLPLFHNNQPPFENADKDTKKHELSLFGRYLGITFIADTYAEVTLTEELHTEESTVQAAIHALKQEIDAEVLPNSTLLSLSYSSKIIDETTVEVSVTAEYKEDIAKKVKGNLLENDT